MHFIPSKLNPADRPSREVDMMETTLSEESAREINIVFGPHSVDLMASESNVHRFLTVFLLDTYLKTKHHRHQVLMFLLKIYRGNAIRMFFPYLR